MTQAKIVVIEMDKERHLKGGTNANIFLEENLGRPLTEIADSFSFRDMRTMFYSFLKWEDKSLTYEQTGDIMDACIEKHGMEYLSGKLAEIMEKSFGGGNAVPSE